MPTDKEQSPVAIALRRYRGRNAMCLIAVVLTGFIADGSRRIPADATKPITLHGSALHPDTASKRLRVATFNIHSGRGRDRKTDLGRTASVLKSELLDVVGLNEVRGTLHEPWWPDQSADLGQRLGMESVFLPTERRWWHDHFGNALLTRIPIREFHRIPLVGTRGKAYRCATLAQFDFQQQPIQLLSVHVDSQTDREHELRSVISLFLGLKSPAILIGDLNSGPDDPQLKQLVAQTDVVDALKDIKGPRIDWIIARGFRCATARLIENDASDHPAVIADLELNDEYLKTNPYK